MTETRVISFSQELFCLLFRDGREGHWRVEHGLPHDAEVVELSLNPQFNGRPPEIMMTIRGDWPSPSRLGPWKNMMTGREVILDDICARHVDCLKIEEDEK